MLFDASGLKYFAGQNERKDDWKKLGCETNFFE